MNRLASQTSPYLLQHADNPVEWYPWGPQALERAKTEDKPILLSIGYAACHWCHVMAHESFEDEDTARLMNELFVNIKVDREERPDLDSIYMQAVQALTGHGGWPMTVFLTPDGVPFYGGTYYPKEERYGMPSFKRVLQAVANAYRTNPAGVRSTSEQIREIYSTTQAPLPAGTLSPAVFERAYRALAGAFDEQHAGFSAAPKFPPSMALDFLLRHWRRTETTRALEMVMRTFIAMARGGIYDQIGGGLHRYSVDELWLVPHFEKMLYDNALFIRLGVHLWQATKDEEVRRVTEETLRWLEREMTSPDGGFYSSLDADSEGHEGKFYVWDLDELHKSLGSEARIAAAYWGVTPQGNFEGKNILHVPHDVQEVAQRLGMAPEDVVATVARAREGLYALRAARVWPGRDDKVLAAWNGLMLRGVAEAARAFRSDEWKGLAVRNANFLWSAMTRIDVGNGGSGEGPLARIVRAHKDGSSTSVGFLEDHAAVALGFLDLYPVTGDRVWLERAVALGRGVVEYFFDRQARVFYDTPHDHEALITRPRDMTDNATPAGQSLAAELLFRLAEYTGNEEYREIAHHTVASHAEPMSRYPSAFGHLLGVADGLVHGAIEVVIARGANGSDEAEALLGVVAVRYLPSLVMASGPDPEVEALALGAGKVSVGGRATAYVCRRYTCEAPVQHPEGLATQLDRAVLPGV